MDPSDPPAPMSVWQNVDIVLFPELCVTGYTCGDLFYQDALHNAVDAGMKEILNCSAEHPELTAVIGLPVRSGMKLLNCAAVVSGGQILEETQVVNSIEEVFSPYTDYERFLAYAHSEDLELIISNTTEAGITYDPSCKLDKHNESNLSDWKSISYTRDY